MTGEQKTARARRKRRKHIVRAFASAALAALMVLALSSCRPTDFFTEVIIDPLADKVDYDNPDATIVNDADAEDTSDQLSALDWSDDATQSQEVQNIVTYAGDDGDPTTNAEAHRSIFDLAPRFPGVKSSEPVTLDFSTPPSDDSPQQETNPNPTELSEAAQNTILEGQQGQTQGSEQATGPSDTGDAQSETPNEEPKGGYGADELVYNTNDPLFRNINHTDHVAATGNAAVLVQMLGGQGALAAMDASTYNGTGETASTFATVFGDELSEGFADTALLWRNTGASSDDVVDINAIADACGDNGAIVYDQNEATAAERFTDEQATVLGNRGIQLIPVDFSSIASIKQAASALEQVLSEDSTEPVASSMAERYKTSLDDLMDQATSAHTGSGTVYGLAATHYVTGIQYSGNSQIDTTSGLLFTDNSSSTTLDECFDAAGITDRAEQATTEQGSASRYAVVWAYQNQSSTPSVFSGNRTYVGNLSETSVTLWENARTTDGSNVTGNGLGSSTFPYLIVGDEAADSRSALLGQMVPRTAAPLQAYSLLPGCTLGESAEINSYLGSIKGQNGVNAFLDNGLSVSDTVRTNPRGLLGSWCEGSPESALEAVWLARIYSAAPANSTYSPVCNLSAGDLQTAVQEFYRTFYRCDGQYRYEDVVPDQGL